MAVGSEIETRGHVAGFRDEIDKAAKAGKDDFFTWFNTAADADEAFVRGAWDFSYHIAGLLKDYIEKPEEKTALEIGYGGGRLLAASSRSFKKVFGVDLHEHSDLVADELRKRGISNFDLLTGDGRSIPLPDTSVDVIYSFIVLQHVEKVEVFRRYIEESYRIMRKGGVAVIYFGRWAIFSPCRSSRFLYWIDRLLEGCVLNKGFRELPSVVNDINLLVSLGYAKKIARTCGFQVAGTSVSRRKVPDGLKFYGLQNALILKKK